MDRIEFGQLRDHHYGLIAGINDTKGKDYALANFKEGAKALGLTPEQIWHVYANKHWAAVTTFCREGDVASEPIEGRLHDVILYCFLLIGLIEEKKPKTIDVEMQGKTCACGERKELYCLRQDCEHPDLRPEEDDQRRELIELCAEGHPPAEGWTDRDSESAQRQVGELWALLRAGCDFHVSEGHQGRTLDVAVSNIEGFQFHEVGEEGLGHDSFYLPTRERLAQVGDRDWYC